MEASSNNYSAGLFLCLCLLLVNHVHSRSQSPFEMHNFPHFLPSSNNFTFQAGQEAKLTCAIVNLGDKNVIWRRASKKTPLTVGTMSFSEDPRISIQHIRENNEWNLVIIPVRESDAGVYECQVSSRMKHLRHHVTLMVTDPPPPPVRPKIQISGSNYVDEGDRIRLVCNATSKEYPPEDIDWFRNGDALTSRPSAGMFITKKVYLSTGTIFSALEIRSANLSDQGPYVCRTSNKDVTSIYVNVLNGPTKNVKRGTVKKDGLTDYSGESNGNRASTASLSSCLMVVGSILALLTTTRHRLVLEVT